MDPTEQPIERLPSAVIARADGPMIMRLFNEAMAMVMDATGYLEGYGAIDQDGLDSQLRMVFAGESMRVTTRLMQVVAWLLAQRAVLAGQMTQDEASGDAFRLGARAVCLGGPCGDVTALPFRLQDLLTRSETLYLRVERLERLVMGVAPPRPAAGFAPHLVVR